MRESFKIFCDALFFKNMTLTMGLGLVPLLLFSNSLLHALLCAAATVVVLLITSVFVSFLRHFIPRGIETVLYVLISAGISYLLATVLITFFPDFRHFFWWFLPFIAVNTMYVWSAENFFAHNKILPSAIYALGAGLGFSVLMILLGAVRELFGTGCLLGVSLFDPSHTVPYFTLPAGGLLLLGLLMGLLSYVRGKFGKGDMTK